MIKVLFVDDEPRLRLAWEKLFASQPDMKLVAVLPRADTVEDAVGALLPDILVMDLNMPGVEPLSVVRSLAASRPEVRSIVYSAHSGPEPVRAAFDAGAWGYLDKLAMATEMFAVIRRVIAGEVVFPQMSPPRD
jgi:two-component system response regulator DesR